MGNGSSLAWLKNMRQQIKAPKSICVDEQQTSLSQGKGMKLGELKEEPRPSRVE
jgi:hypothetical protein